MLTDKEKLLMYIVLYQNACNQKQKPLSIDVIDKIRKLICPGMGYSDMVEMFTEIEKELKRYSILVAIMDDVQPS